MVLNNLWKFTYEKFPRNTVGELILDSEPENTVLYS